MAEYITKKAAIKAVENAPIELFQSEWEEIEEAINAVPAADVVPVVHAHWIEQDGMQICSNCGEEHTWDDFRSAYCDCCGAKMDGGGDND